MARPRKVTTTSVDETKKTETAKTVAESTVKAADKAPATKKPAAKKVSVSENVYIQANGSEVNTADIIEKAKTDSGIKTPKSVNIYIKPEENKVFYVINDDNKGDFDLF